MLKKINWHPGSLLELLILIGLLLMPAPSYSGTKVKKQPYDLLPEAFIYQHPVSQSQWLWNDSAPVKDGAKSFFRLEVNLNEPVRQAFIRIHFDDQGQFFVNGIPCSATDLPKHLKLGRNVLAFELKNEFAVGGLLFYGEIVLKSGKTVFLHSNRNQVKAAPHFEAKWHTCQFSAEHWHPALMQGDVTTAPWSTYGSYISRFCSPRELQNIRSQEKRALSLPPTLASEPDSQAKIVYDHYRPFIEINGKKFEPIFHLGGVNNVFKDNITIKLARMGIKIFRLGIGDDLFYRSEGNYDFSRLDRDARRLLQLVPDAQILIHFRSSTMQKWCQDNPREIIGFTTGTPEPRCRDERLGRPVRPSAASEKFRAEILRELQALISYLRQQPWHKRVIGFHLGYGIYGEWHTYGMYHGPDTGPAMTGKFRQYLTRFYGTDQALQHSWRQKNVTLQNATIPAGEARTNPQGFLLDPVKNRPTLDFYNCLQEVQTDLLLLMAHEVKRLMPGKLCGAYYGYVFSSQPPEGANVLLDRVLSSPDLDFLCNPPSYTALSRRVGGDFAPRTVTASFHRYGKLAVLEDDTRYHQNYIVKRNYNHRTATESFMATRRNFGNLIFDGAGTQIMDAENGVGTRPHTFDDPAILNALQGFLKILPELRHLPEVSSNDTAVVIDYRERLRIDNQARRHDHRANLLYDSTQQFLNRSGAALDIMTLQDFLATKARYRVVVFLNLFSPTAPERRIIRQKLSQMKSTAVWLLAPGGVTSNGFSDQAMSDLTGIRLHGASCNPQVKNQDPEAREILPGVISKNLPDKSRSVFVAQIPDSGAKWQKILQSSGSHIYTSSGNYFRKHGDVFMLHVKQSGTYRINLPDKSSTYRELFQNKLYPGNQLIWHSSGPETRIFKKVTPAK